MTKEEIQKAKWLGQYNGFTRRIKRMEGEIEEWRCKLEGLGAQLIDGMPKATGNKKGWETLIQEIIELDEMLLEENIKLVEKRKMILRAVNTIKDPLLQVLVEHRYIDGMKWKSVCMKLNYSKKQIHRMHVKALNQIMIEDDTQ